jgi:hypothetical protein
MATLHQIVIQRNEDLIRRFHEDRLPSHAALMNLKDAPQNHALGGGEIKPLPGALGPKIWEKGTKHETSLWVPKTYSNYREAFFKFIKHLYGNDVDMAGAKAYDVDHLFNRERASAGAMIRVEAVSASVNRSHGAGYEKTAGASTVAISRQAKMRPFTKIDFISVLKSLVSQHPHPQQTNPGSTSSNSTLKSWGSRQIKSKRGLIIYWKSRNGVKPTSVCDDDSYGHRETTYVLRPTSPDRIPSHPDFRVTQRRGLP